jgi:hypothetical protein
MGGWKKPSLLLNLHGNHVDDGSQDLAIEKMVGDDGLEPPTSSL